MLALAGPPSLTADSLTADSLEHHGPYWSGAVHRGFVIPHRPNVLHLIQGHTLGGNISAEWPVKNNRKWVHAFQSPSLGFDVYASSTGNNEQLGSQYALHGFTRLPLGNTRVQQYLKLGLGLGWATQIWDLENNVRAAVLGSHLNTALALEYGAQWAFSEHLQFSAGLRLEHFSNGAYQLPNLGTNIASVYLGLGQFCPRTVVADRPNVDRFSRSRYWEHSASLSAGIKEFDKPLGNKYGVYVLGYSAQHRWTYKSSVIGGLDLFYNRAMRAALDEPDAPNSRLLLAGAAVGYGLHFNAMELRMMMGVYVVDPYKGNGNFYHRFGLRYWVNRKLFVKFTLRTHFARADHGELGIGVKLHRTPPIAAIHDPHF